jgi:hypothetical protein
MKKFITVFLLFAASYAFSQTDNNGNPVFNSVTTHEELIQDFHLSFNYYTLKNNIDNKGSSVFISDTPTLDQIENAATSLPSNFFIILRRGTVLNMIIVLDKPGRKFLVINPATGKRNQFRCKIKGEISEDRAMEIVKENYDPAAKIERGMLFFNNKKFVISANSEIKDAVLNLVSDEKLAIADSTHIKILSKDELKAKIIAETKEGGSFDFFTKIKGHEYDAFAIKPGLIATNIEIALYKWGRVNSDLGVDTVQDALAIWAEIKGRPANSRELGMITKGFNKELEK